MAFAPSVRRVSAVLYHYPCPDGAFAALAAHLYFSAAALPVRFFPNTVYDPIRSDALPFDEIKDIYLLDFVGPPGFVTDIAPKVESVTILDHHKTAFESLCGNTTLGKNVNKVIDMQRSGATIAFDFFSNKLLTIGSSAWNHGSDNAVNGVKYLPDNKLETVHKLFKFIEDGDLWRWTIPNSKAFSSGLKDLDIEFDVNINRKLFDQASMNLLLELDPEDVISHGQATLSHKQKLIDDCLEKSYEIALGHGKFGNCLAVNADAISTLRSELGNQLAEKSRNLNLRQRYVVLTRTNGTSRSIGAVVYKVPELNNDNMLKISLRSLNEEDTTSISKEYGGGGHRNASSFLLSGTEFDRWKVGAGPFNTKM
uniref:DHHA1 domain-containing protein n=1 Tax=Oryza punctata TaxID=4537 RepID=A0A0E0K3Q1_ORYPU